MAYMPEDEKERIKREVSIQRLAEARGIKLRRSGKELIGLCPFHDDRNPSLNIDPAKNVWSCKGACGEGGDVFLWVMRAEGVSFNHAKELLRKNYSPSSGPVVKQSTVPKLPCPVTLGAEDRAVMLEVVRFYSQTLRETVEAKRYLEKRGLEVVGDGGAVPAGVQRPDAGAGVAGPEPSRRRGGAGPVGAAGHHPQGERTRASARSLIVPIMNLDGDVVQLYGRKINAESSRRNADHLYLPGPMRGVWNEEAFVASKEIILCEALIDALTFWCAGFRHVTASYGQRLHRRPQSGLPEARHRARVHRV
jgi:DNA primase